MIRIYNNNSNNKIKRNNKFNKARKILYINNSKKGSIDKNYNRKIIVIKIKIMILIILGIW